MKADVIQIGSKYFGVIKDGDTVVWKSVPHTSGKMALEEARRRLAHPGKSLSTIQGKAEK